ncbi:hypothetical protein, partial [Staphylococcus aureus]|uniref:hypothetical protein n=1 Tax=Staphylococcus aureus TaxID=1280 RepID=UPI001FD3BC36
RPDICIFGVITGVKKICEIAHVYDKTLQIHVCGVPMSTAVARHMKTFFFFKQKTAYEIHGLGDVYKRQV